MEDMVTTFLYMVICNEILSECS